MQRNQQHLEECVTIAKPKTLDFEMVKTLLIHGLLKALTSKKNEKVPKMLFEISDVCFKDESQETRANNQRNLTLVYLLTTSGFETVHSTLDLILTKCRIENVKDYILVPSQDPMFFPAECHDIMFKGKKLGQMSTLCP